MSADRRAPRLNDEAREILTKLKDVRLPKALVLNKIDTVENTTLLGLAQSINELCPFDDTFMVSALKGYGVPTMLEKLAAKMQPGPWLFPEDQITEAPMRVFAAEITREKLFERLHDELPYNLTVETEQWKDLPDGSARIEQTIYVTRDAHKKIVIGEGGRTLKSVGSAARKDIAEAAEQKVHLFLFVKVRERWLDDPDRYREMGLDFPKE